MINLTELLTIANLVLIVAVIVGGYLAVKSAITKANQDTQARVREALHDENELLQARVNRVEKENRRLDKLMQLLVIMLKKTQGIDLEIDDDVITMRTASGTHVSRITGDLVP